MQQIKRYSEKNQKIRRSIQTIESM